MNRLTERNIEGIGVLKQPFACERCGDLQWSLPDLGNGDPIDRLTEYEDLEEQGKLLRLPCAVDSEVWYLDKYHDIYAEKIVRGVVNGYSWYRSCGFALDIVWDSPIMGHFGYKRKEIPFSEIGKTLFLTKEDAETALRGGISNYG